MQISQVSEHAELLSREDQGAQTREALPPSRSPGWGERPWVRALPSFIRVDQSFNPCGARISQMAHLEGLYK